MGPGSHICLSRNCSTARLTLIPNHLSMNYVIPLIATTEAKILIQNLCDELDVLKIAIDSVNIDLSIARNAMTRMTTSPLVAASRAHRYTMSFHELKRFCNQFASKYKEACSLASINKATWNSCDLSEYSNFIDSWRQDIKLAVFPNKVSL